MCFVTGCMIATPGGSRRVEGIAPGDLVTTISGRSERVLWVGQSRIPWAEQMANPRKRPVRIGKDALGPGVPERAVMISPQHRVLVRSPQVARLAGSREALVPALALTALPGVRVMPSLPGLNYVHIACAHHVLLLAEGAGVESILPEPILMQELGPTERIALAEVFASQTTLTQTGGAALDPAHPVLSMRKAETLVERSMRSRMPLVVPLRTDAEARKASG